MLINNGHSLHAIFKTVFIQGPRTNEILLIQRNLEYELHSLIPDTLVSVGLQPDLNIIRSSAEPIVISKTAKNSHLKLMWILLEDFQKNENYLITSLSKTI